MQFGRIVELSMKMNSGYDYYNLGKSLYKCMHCVSSSFGSLYGTMNELRIYEVASPTACSRDAFDLFHSFTF